MATGRPHLPAARRGALTLLLAVAGLVLAALVLPAAPPDADQSPVVAGADARDIRRSVEAVFRPVSAVSAPLVLETPVAAPASQSTSAGSIVLHRPETWDAVSAANVGRALALLPPDVRAQLGNPALGPVHIVISVDGRTRSGYQPYGQAANFFSTNEGTNELVLYPGQAVVTVLHELGHAYNLRHSPAGNYAAVLLEPEMQGFLAAAGWRLLTPVSQIAAEYDHSRVLMVNDGPQVWTTLSRDDALEDFANSFALYFSDAEALSALSPARYAWFEATFARCPTPGGCLAW